MRGFDVEAIARVKKMGHVSQSLAMKTQLAWVDPKTNSLPDVKSAFNFNEFIEKASGDGRYHVRFQYLRGGGHIITFERKNGKIRFYDPQTGWKYNSPEEINKKYDSQSLAQIKYNSIGYYRVDNLTLNIDYVKAVKKKKK
jgi:hypothetical protein